MSIHETVLGGIGHSAFLGPDDSIADNPTIVTCCRLDACRDASEASFEVGVSDIEEHGTTWAKYTSPLSEAFE
jgi:hypothetical protein